VALQNLLDRIIILGSMDQLFVVILDSVKFSSDECLLMWPRKRSNTSLTNVRVGNLQTSAGKTGGASVSSGVSVSVSLCLHNRSFHNDSQCKKSDPMNDFGFRRIVKSLKHVAYPRSLIVHMIANRITRNPPIPIGHDGVRVNPSNDPPSDERAAMPLQTLPTTASISWRCCDMTILRACSIVNVVASVSNTGSKGQPGSTNCRSALERVSCPGRVDEGGVGVG
jgi:hypothetical protein